MASKTSLLPPIASTSRQQLEPPTPSHTEYEASRLDWDDLLAEESGTDLLNDESESWLLDRSAFTIGARTPGKGKQRLRRTPTPEPEEAESATAATHTTGDPAVDDVQTRLEPEEQAVRVSASKSSAPAISLPASSRERTRSISPLAPAAAERQSNEGGAVGHDSASPINSSSKDVSAIPSLPPPETAEVPEPVQQTVTEVAQEIGASQLSASARRHRPSLAPLPQRGHSPVEQHILPPPTRSSPDPAELPEAGVQRQQDLAEKSRASEDAAPTALAPVAAGPADPAGRIPTTAQLATTPCLPSKDANSFHEKHRSPAIDGEPTPATRIVPSAPTAGHAPPTRPAHLLTANHPSHPRPRAPLAGATNKHKGKGMRGPDEDARRKVREAKEARERQAKERKEQAEKAAEAVREAKRKEKKEAEAVAAAAAREQKRRDERRELPPRPPRVAVSTKAPRTTVEPRHTDRADETEQVGAETAAPVVLATVPGDPASSEPAVMELPTQAVALPSAPAVIVSAADESTADCLDANLTLPDMGAPLDFGAESAGASQAPNLAATSTPARHLKRTASSGVEAAPTAGPPTESDAVRQKRPRRVSSAPAPLPSTSGHAAGTAISAMPPIAEEDGFTGADQPPPLAGSRSPASEQPEPAKRRRPSRLSIAADATGGVHSSNVTANDTSGRTRVVRVTLVAPDVPPRGSNNASASAPTRRASTSLKASITSAPEGPMHVAPREEQRNGPELPGSASRRRRASRVSMVPHEHALGQESAERPGADSQSLPFASSSGPPIADTRASAAATTVGAPAASPVAVELPPRPRPQAALVIGGITLPASFTFAEESEETEAERARRLRERERREKAAEAVLVEKKRLRESVSAWAVRPDEAVKRPRLLDNDDSQQATHITASAVSSNVAGSAFGRAQPLPQPPAQAPAPAPRRARRSIAPSASKAPVAEEAEAPVAEEAEAPHKVSAPSALTKEALERNARRAGPRPDLHRRVSNFLSEISEAEESFEEDAGRMDVSLKQSDESGAVQGGSSGPEAQESISASRSGSTSNHLPPPAPVPQQNAIVAPSVVPERMPEQDHPAGGVKERPLSGARGGHNAASARSAVVRPAEDALPPAKKARRDPAPATLLRARSQGQENGPKQQGGVAAALEKQTQARLAWSERQKKREEDAKRFRQRQREEEAAREREKLKLLRSSLTQARGKPSVALGARPVGRT
ncbi:hypothetical protein JCM8202v2_000109 [Rhodotorula sphaerocarpa]